MHVRLVRDAKKAPPEAPYELLAPLRQHPSHKLLSLLPCVCVCVCLRAFVCVSVCGFLVCVFLECVFNVCMCVYDGHGGKKKAEIETKVRQRLRRDRE